MLKPLSQRSEARDMRLRLRLRARRPVKGQDDMWFTVPSSGPEDGDAGGPAPRRSEEPTYEDHWYQVLRRRSGERAPAD